MAQGVWVKVFPPPPVVKPELPGLGGWAEISDAVVKTTTGADGVKWNVWAFYASGDHKLTVTKAGLLECLVVSGWAGSQTDPSIGRRQAQRAVIQVPAGALTVHVGPKAFDHIPGATRSTIGTLLHATTGAYQDDVGVPFGTGKQFLSDIGEPAAYDYGPSAYNAGAGVVIVRRPA